KDHPAPFPGSLPDGLIRPGGARPAVSSSRSQERTDSKWSPEGEGFESPELGWVDEVVGIKVASAASEVPGESWGSQDQGPDHDRDVAPAEHGGFPERHRAQPSRIRGRWGAIIESW